MKNIEGREPLSMAEAENYWKSLWGEGAQHNERGELIRREQKRKISHMDWRPIDITEITSYLLYAFFWVNPRLLKFICRRFGTLCLFHLHRQVGACRMN